MSNQKSLKITNGYSDDVEKDRKYNGLKKNRDKRTNNDLQSIARKTKDQGTRTPFKTGVNSGAPEGKAVPVTRGHSSCYSCYSPVIGHE
jgi:hypothetical protein